MQRAQILNQAVHRTDDQVVDKHGPNPMVSRQAHTMGYAVAGKIQGARWIGCALWFCAAQRIGIRTSKSIQETDTMVEMNEGRSDARLG